MKEAIGMSFIFNLIMIFTGVLIIIYVGSIAYTKGFKIRNKMIDIIEKYDGYLPNEGNDAYDEIHADLASIGYKVIPDGEEADCKDRSRDNVDDDYLLYDENGYNYCIYRYTDKYGPYYGVTVFVYFDIPLLGNQIKIPIYGETRVLLDKEFIDG